MKPSRTLRPTLWIDGKQALTWDQTRLPFERVAISLASSADCARAIAAMQVRGAPLIGAVAALGMAMAIDESLQQNPQARLQSDWLDALARPLLATRPTAVNLAWGIKQVCSAVSKAQGEYSLAAWQSAVALIEADVACNHAIGMQTQIALREQAAHATRERPLKLLTHCNAGALATVDWGTASAAMYQLHAAGVPLHVWVDETRPRNQGASLTAYELADAGIPHTVIADNAGGLLMMRGQVDAVIVGCDRVCANGDVVNKIGTYLKALAAKAHNIPFWVACPRSTIDLNCANGLAVAIEERSTLELSRVRGRLVDGGEDADGLTVEVDIMSPGQHCYNPGFDITPAALVSALITEDAVLSPHAIRDYCP